MATSPQLENGYMRVANEYVEALVRQQYSPSILRLLLAVMRETWGWNATQRAIPITRLAELLGVSPRRVYQLRAQAVNLNLLIVEEQGNGDAHYAIQTDYSEWRSAWTEEYHSDQTEGRPSHLSEVGPSDQTEEGPSQWCEGRPSDQCEGGPSESIIKDSLKDSIKDKQPSYPTESSTPVDDDPFGPSLRPTTAEGQPPAPDGADASPAPSGNDSLRQRGKGPTYEEIMATFSEDERRLVNEALDLLADWRPDGSRLENARQFVEVRDLAPAAFARVLAEGRRVDGGRGPKTVKYYRQIALAAASAPPEKWPKLRAAIGRLNMPPHTQDNWVRVLGNAVEGAGDKWVTSEDQIVALLAEYPPKAAEENLPVKWLERVEKARGSGSYAVPHTWVGGEWEALGFKVYQPRNETPEEGDGSEAATPAQEGRCAGFRHLMDEGVDANAVLEAMGFRVCRPKAPEEEEAPQSTTPEKKAQHETKTPEEGIVFDLNDFRPKTEGARDSPDLDAIQWDEPEGLEFDENGDEVEDWDEIEDDDYEAAQ